MGLFGRSVISDAELATLRESGEHLRIARREMEDIGWSLLNAPNGEALGDIPALDRNKIIAQGVKYWARDPLIGPSVDMYTDYVIGTGVPMPQADNKALAELFSRFWNDPDNKLILTTMDAQRMKLAELQLTGNVFPVAFVNTGNGHVKLSDVPVKEITDIITDPDNRKRHVFYRRDWIDSVYDFDSGTYKPGDRQRLYYPSWRFKPGKTSESEPAFGPTKESEKVADLTVMFHWSTNRLSDGKFGNPRIMRIIEWVRAYNEFSKARVSIMRALAKFAWHRKVKGNAGDVRKLAAAFVDGNIAGATPDGMFTPPPPQYAATVTTNEAISYDAMKTDTGGASALQDGRMLKGSVASGSGFPLHYLGDVGGANLATATSMELPVLKMIEAGQGYVEGWIRDIIDFVIDCAIKFGDLPPLSEGRFTKERVNERLRGEYNTGGTAKADHPEGDDQAITEASAADDGDRNEYEYRLNMPSILKRQVSETINAAVNMVKSIDPYSQNVDASRWLLEFTLEVMGVPNPKGVSTKVFPADFEYPKTDTNADGVIGGEDGQVDAQRGRSDTLANDGRGQPDFKKGRKPTSTQSAGQKGAKTARQPGEIATSTTEAEAMFLDMIDAAMLRMEESDLEPDAAPTAAEADADAT